MHRKGFELASITKIILLSLFFMLLVFTFALNILTVYVDYAYGLVSYFADDRRVIVCNRLRRKFAIDVFDVGYI